MPSILVDLPKNVEKSQPRTDGSCRYYFRVKRNRPANWPPTISFTGCDQYGNRVDEIAVPAAFAVALENWANELNSKLRTERESKQTTFGRGSLPWLWEDYKAEQRYQTKRPKTKDNYRKLARTVCEWSSRMGHPHVRSLHYEGVRQFLSGWKDTPYQQRAFQRFLSLLFQHAMRMKLCDFNPASKLGISVPKSKVRPWEDDVVSLLVNAAIASGRESVATAILIMRDLGMREEDLLQLRSPDNYIAGRFYFSTSKTDVELSIPCSSELRSYMEKKGTPLHRCLIISEKTGQPYKPDNFRHIFSNVRGLAGTLMTMNALCNLISGQSHFPFINLSEFKFRQLRHTAILNLARAGCEIVEIRAVTGHTLKSVHQILEHYLPRDSITAGNAIGKMEIHRRKLASEQKSNEAVQRLSNGAPDKPITH